MVVVCGTITVQLLYNDPLNQGSLHNEESGVGVPIVKDDENLFVEWATTWGGAKNEEGNAITLDSQSNIYIAGNTMSFGNSKPAMNDICIIKYNHTGVQLWNKTWGGEFGERCYEMEIDSNDNVYVLGYTTSYGAGGSDAFLNKYNPSGNMEWTRTWGGANNEIGYDLVIDNDDSIYITGITKSYGDLNGDIFLVKLSENGSILWSCTWGDDNISEYAYAITLDDMCKNIFITGYLYYIGWDQIDILLLKFNATGDHLWSVIFGQNHQEAANDIVLDSANNIYIAGYIRNVEIFDSDILLIKFNSLGEFQWSRTWHRGDIDQAKAVILDSSQNILLVGQSNSDGVIVKFDSHGKLQNTHIFHEDIYSSLNNIAFNSVDRLLIVGNTKIGINKGDISLITAHFK